MKLCSACLLGIACRYDGKSKLNEKIIELSKNEVLIPFCPEQLGGLKTPRTPAEQKDNKVFTKEGEDVTNNFIKGAEESLKLAKLYPIKEAILKETSPSCGSKLIYDGTFSSNKIKGQGVTTTLSRKNKIKVISEEEL